MKKTASVFILTIFLSAFLTAEKNNKDSRILGYRKNYARKENSGVEIKGKNYSHKKKKKIEKIIPSPIPPVTIQDPTKEQTENIESPGYVGEMKDGKKHGRGKLVLRNGDVYIGSWRDGRKSGQGIYIYSNGIKYNGQWKDDIMEGSGSFVFPKTGSYYGDIKNGQMTGYGLFKYHDGSVYEGGWKDGKWNGKGKYSLPDGRKIEAVFADHQVVKILSQTGQNTVKVEDGSGKK